VIDALPKSTARLASVAPFQGLGPIPSASALARKRPGDLQPADAPLVASRLSREGLSLIAGLPAAMPLPAPPSQVVAAAHTATRTGKPDSVRGDQHRRPTVTATQLLTLMGSPCNAMLFLESVASAIGPGAFLRMPAR